ncbi:enoyl-CoA hydratase/isomerase family protein [Micromonospora sp. NPDC048830]|uniref:enoyl-CoA hydratase/isomerase family protein n=1 Tax=Micromonospora sp. NPDC048830 TaxID=3364257 RepID=UPI0037178F80
MDRAVRTEIVDGVCFVTLVAAANGNAINFDLIDGLEGALDAVDADPDCRAMVISAEGPTFCRGLDLEAFFVHGNLPERARLRRLPACLARIRRARVPVLAVADGEATGGGVGLLAACDLVLATANARFMLSEPIVGLVPATIVPFLLLRIGPARLRAMTLSTRGVPAAEAHLYGLVDELVDGPVEPALRAQLQRIFRSAPPALAEAKRYYDQVGAADLDRQIEVGLDQFTTWLARPDVLAGVTSFGEGFAPPWFARYRGRMDVPGHSGT